MHFPKTKKAFIIPQPGTSHPFVPLFLSPFGQNPLLSQAVAFSPEVSITLFSSTDLNNQQNPITLREIVLSEDSV